MDWMLYKLLQPKAVLVENADDVFGARFASTFEDFLRHGDAWFEAHHTSLRNMLLQLNSLQKVHELVDNLGQEAPYDVIIASRPDLWFFNTLNVSQVQDAGNFLSRLYVGDFEHWGGLNDRFAFGGTRAMDVYCNRIRDIVDFAATHQVHAETFLKHVAKDAELDVQFASIVFERVRSHGLMQHVPQFHDGPEKRVSTWGEGQYMQKDAYAMWGLSPEQPTQ